MRCRVCGKEFEPKQSTQKYCGYDCYAKQNEKYSEAYRIIKSIKKKFGFDVKNKDKIIRAKTIMFDKGEQHRCPCDSQNKNRYCGSALCIADVVYKGHCHCNLFFAEKTLQERNDGV
jgi:hypothetical protein